MDARLQDRETKGFFVSRLFRALVKIRQLPVPLWICALLPALYYLQLIYPIMLPTVDQLPADFTNYFVFSNSHLLLNFLTNFQFLLFRENENGLRTTIMYLSLALYALLALLLALEAL